MPAASSYDPTDKDLRAEADKEYGIRETAHGKAQDWYDGNMPDVLAIKKNPKGPNIDNNIKLNMFKKRLDRRRDFLFKTFPQLDIDDAPDESETEKWLRLAWEWNKAATLWGLALQNGGFSGQGFIEIRKPRPGRDKYPRAILLSNVIIWWQADDVDTHLWYEKRWKVGKTQFRQDILDLDALDMGSGWLTIEYKREQRDSSNQKEWVQTDEIAWDYELGPIVTWQHWPRKSCYGADEFGDIHLNTALNRIMSLGNKVIRNHAYPKTIGTGFQGKQLQQSDVDDFWTIDDKDAKVYNLEMQSDLSAILNYSEQLKEEYTSQGRTVDIEGGPADFTNITNLAIKVAFLPQDDANSILQRQYGDAIIAASKRLQMVDGQPYDVDPKIVWKPSLPQSQLEQSQVAEAQKRMGLASDETLATEMGLDWAQEQERMQKEQQVSKIRRFGKQDVAAAQAAFNNLPGLAELQSRQNGGSGANGGMNGG